MIEAPASPVLAAALRWIKRGAAPIPVRYKEKVPVGAAWQTQRLDAADAPAVFNEAPLNLGVLWGEPTGNVVDVDLDWPEACAIAAALLPATAVYGRASSRHSHRLYRVPAAVTGKWSVSVELVPEGRKSVVLELRADGTQSVVPPSTHPSGELYEWARERMPQSIEYATLVRRLNFAAAGAVLVRYWREGIRHQLALALAGAALSAGYTVNEIGTLITAIAEAAGDPEARDRARAVQSSAAALTEGRPATGVPKLAELVGEPIVAVLKKWLGLANAVPLMASSSSATAWAPVDVAEEFKLRCAADVERQPVAWLWPQRIPRGKLGLIGGRPDGGKSTLAAELAAHVTRGTVWPIDGTDCPKGDVLVLNVEDDPSDTIRPRLEAAGADLSRVQIIDAVMRAADKKERQVTLADVGILDALLTQHPGRFVLLTVDPFGAFLAGRDSHRDAEVRELLAPFSVLAGKHNIAVVFVAHLSKAVGIDALYRVLGSVGITGAVRSVYFVIADPDDDMRRLFVPVKGNNVAVRMLGLAFTLQNVDLGEGVAAARVCWQSGGEQRTADELLAPPHPEGPERAAAEAWLRERLADGPVAVAELKIDAPLQVAASWPTVERVARALGVVGRGEKRARTWELPPETAPSIKPPEQTITQMADVLDGKQTITEMVSIPSKPSDLCVDGKPPDADVKPAEPSSGQSIGSLPDGLMAQWPDGVSDAVVTAAPAATIEGSAQAALPLADTSAVTLHPCTNCSRLNVGHFCSKYQCVMPWPEKPNACVHFEPRLPDTPWE